MAKDAPVLPGLSPVGGKLVQVAFDGGRLTSDAGVLVLAEIERRLGLAERLARCIEDTRAPERVRHDLAEMIRFRALLIAAGYADANDCDALRTDPAFKMAVGRLPESGADLCSQPTMCRLENLPGPTALKRMMAAMVELFCGKTPGGAEVALVLRHVVRAIRRRWPAVEILIRGDGHYSRPEALDWLERNRVGYIFGLGGNKVLLARAAPLADDAAVSRVAGAAAKVRRFGAFRYAAKTWSVERQVIARVEASAQGSDTRFIVTNLKGTPRWLYEEVYCARGQAENLIKAHKLHLASDRTSCSKATANQFRLLIHTAAYWLLHSMRGLAPKTSFWREAQFDTIRLALIKLAGRVTEMTTRIKVALPSAYPYRETLALLSTRAAKLPP